MQAIVVISPHGTVQFATLRAETWLKGIFGATAAPKRLPTSICRWVDKSAADRQSKPFIIGHNATRLRIDFLYR